MEYSMGFSYNRGKRVSYTITAPKLDGALGLCVSGVSSGDKNRIITEMAKRRGCKKTEIEVERVVE